MDSQKLMEQIRKREDNTDYLARAAAGDISLVADLMECVGSRESAVKYKSIKILRNLSKENPAALYPYFDNLVNLLDSSSNILKWNTIDILANLTAVDAKDKFGSVFRKFFGLLGEGSLITAAHVVESSPAIVKNRPSQETEITRALLNVERIPLPTEECRNILRGKVILAFSQYSGQSGNKPDMTGFATQQLNNTRPATRKKAEQFVKKLAPITHNSEK
jgi:hypothetical protein